MTSDRYPTRLLRSLASLILIISIGAVGCGEEAGSPQVTVTANNFADLATASAEAARGAYVAERIAIELAAQAFDLRQTPAGPAGETTYEYTGNTFTDTLRSSHVGQSVTMSITLSEPLAANVSDFTVNPIVTAFSAHDGVNTIVNGQANFFVGRFTTDDTGAITEWGVDVRADNASASTNFIRTCNTGSTVSPTGSGPDADDCDALDTIDRGKQGSITGSRDLWGQVESNPGVWSTDPLCDTGTSSLTEDGANPGRYEIEYVDCVQIEQSQTCTIDGLLILEEGEVDGAPFTAQGSNLQVDCSVWGTFDFDASRLACDYDARGGEPIFDIDICTLDLPVITGHVSGLDYAVSSIEATGPSDAALALGMIVDPDHGEFSFETTELDIETCDWNVPYTGLVGSGREFGKAPQAWAIFEDNCDEFTACYFETQDDLDAIRCTLTSAVEWADVAD